MSDIPSDLRYTESHEWVAETDDGNLRVGVTDHAQSQLGDLVFVELPEQGDRFDAGDACAVVESVKAASDVYCPVTGQVVANNADLEDSPELVNTDCYGDGWLFEIEPDAGADLGRLMDAEAYAESVAE